MCMCIESYYFPNPFLIPVLGCELLFSQTKLISSRSLFCSTHRLPHFSDKMSPTTTFLSWQPYLNRSQDLKNKCNLVFQDDFSHKDNWVFSYRIKNLLVLYSHHSCNCPLNVFHFIIILFICLSKTQKKKNEYITSFILEATLLLKYLLACLAITFYCYHTLNLLEI